MKMKKIVNVTGSNITIGKDTIKPMESIMLEADSISYAIKVRIDSLAKIGFIKVFDEDVDVTKTEKVEEVAVETVVETEPEVIKEPVVDEVVEEAPKKKTRKTTKKQDEEKTEEQEDKE